MDNPTSPPAIIEEVSDSIVATQNIIERNATHLKQLKAEKKLLTEKQKSLVENDLMHSELEKQAEPIIQNMKERKAVIKNTEEAQQLKIKKAEITQEEKEVSETLSNHLTNYYSMTNSKTLDTSSGEQVDFKIKSSFSSKQLELF